MAMGAAGWFQPWKDQEGAWQEGAGWCQPWGQQDGASQEAIGWCLADSEPQGVLLPSLAPAGWKQQPRKIKHFKCFSPGCQCELKGKPVKSQCQREEGSSRQALTAAVLLPGAVSGGSLRDEPSSLSSPSCPCCSGDARAGPALEVRPSSLSKQQHDSPSCSSHPQGHSASQALGWLDPAHFPPQSPSPSSLGIQMD